MGTRPIELAVALGIERQSYHRLEKNWETISTAEFRTIAKTIGVEVSQLWFPPPKTKTEEAESVDDMLDDLPEEVQKMAINAIKGMLGKK